MAYFWFLNDRLGWSILDRQLQAFAAAPEVSAVCLHPRTGLLTPYGGAEWFGLIRRVCRRAAELDLRVWLYDEDPFPSGNAGGRLVTERPELIARGIGMFSFDPTAQGDTRLFCFPTGPLIWCGLVNGKTGEHVDLTGRVRARTAHTPQVINISPAITIKQLDPNDLDSVKHKIESIVSDALVQPTSLIARNAAFVSNY